MTLARKLMIAFGSLALLVLLTAGLGLRAAGVSNDAFAGYVAGAAHRMALANHVIALVDERALAARNLLLTTDPKEMAAARDDALKAQAGIDAELQKLVTSAQTAPDPKVRELVGSIAAVEAKYAVVAKDIVQRAMAGDRDGALARLRTDCHPLLDALQQASDAYLQYSMQRATEESSRADAAHASARLWLLALLVPRSLNQALGA